MSPATRARMFFLSFILFQQIIDPFSVRPSFDYSKYETLIIEEISQGYLFIFSNLVQVTFFTTITGAGDIVDGTDE